MERKRRGSKDHWKENEMKVKGVYIRTKKMRRLRAVAIVFPFVSPGVMMEVGETQME